MADEMKEERQSYQTIQRPKRMRLKSFRIQASQAFERTAGAPLIAGNQVWLLKDARENYPAWLEAIRSAKRTIHFESYIIHEDDQGRLFAEALAEKGVVEVERGHGDAVAGAGESTFHAQPFKEPREGIVLVRERREHRLADAGQVHDKGVCRLDAAAQGNQVGAVADDAAIAVRLAGGSPADRRADEQLLLAAQAVHKEGIARQQRHIQRTALSPGQRPQGLRQLRTKPQGLSRGPVPAARSARP